jgi:Family of unknown function (DUF6194)
MSDDDLPTGPDPEAITRLILERHPDTVTTSAMGAIFFSLDESHWPNFATIVTTDEHDMGAPSRLSERPGTFRLNLGVSRSVAERVARAAGPKPDHAAFGRLLPHPVYARQRWISILNPTHDEVRDVVLPLIDEAHDRLASARARTAAGTRPA